MAIKFNKFTILLIIAVLAITLPGCSNDKKEQPAEKPKVIEPTTEKPELPRPDQSKYGVTSLKGKVLEVVDTGSFIFILLNRGDKQTWATIPAVDVKVGEEVTLLYASIFNNFHSKSMDRTFGELIFSSGIEGKKSGRRVTTMSRKKSASNTSSETK